MVKALIKTLPAEKMPLDAQFIAAGDEWAKAKYQSDILEEMKGPRFEQLKTQLLERLTAAGDTKVPESRLEREVKSSPDWETYIRGMCAAIERTNQAWVKRKAVEIKAGERTDLNANARHEARLQRG